MDWEPIETAPRDGRRVWVKRVFEGVAIAEGEAVFDFFADDAPIRTQMDPDPLKQLKPYEIERERNDTLAYLKERHWLRPDRMQAFPPPTHWCPEKT